MTRVNGRRGKGSTQARSRQGEGIRGGEMKGRRIQYVGKRVRAKTRY